MARAFRGKVLFLHTADGGVVDDPFTSNKAAGCSCAMRNSFKTRGSAAGGGPCVVYPEQDSFVYTSPHTR